MSEQADEPWEYPKGENDGPEVIERYGPGENEIVIWDTTSNYARIRAMRLEGKTVPEISEALQIKPSVVKQCLTNAVKADTAALDADELTTILGMELERLDHALQSVWWSMKAGDLDSLKAVLAIGKERREWLKWAQPEKTAETGITNNVLVIGGTEAEFLANLERARERLESMDGHAGMIEAEIIAQAEEENGD